ncbi:hypothetical protein B0H13DRAFT_2649326 [Mycena leptocephala]|nr:hypothetical protein B0H13DRAFT_2649326 [Mycena leptocephala]
MSLRRLSLHPSALSDAEHALFTASLADLADIDPTSNDAMDWDRISVSVREARAWICGRYASLGTGTIDEILRLFPALTLGGGTFFALLRLVLHTQAGSPIDRSMAFVQAPVPATSRTTASNPFLPTPAPSPESRPRPLRLNSRPTTPKKYSASSESSTSLSSRSTSTSSSSASASSSVPAPPRRHGHGHGHGYSSSLSAAPVAASPPATTNSHSHSIFFTSSTRNVNINANASGRFSSVVSPAPPTHPLRRASAHVQHAIAESATPGVQLGRAPSNANPFRAAFGAPPLPPRRASTSNSPYAASASASHYSKSTSNSHPRTAPPTRSAFAASDVLVPLPPALPSTSNFNSTSNSSVYSLHSADTFESASPFSPVSTQFAFVNGNDNQNGSRRAYPASANPRVSAFSTSTSASTSAFSTSLSLDNDEAEKDRDRAEKPPVHPHRRGTSGGSETSHHGSDFKSDFNTGSGAGSSATRYGNGRRVRSDSSSASTSPSFTFASNSGGPLPLPLALPKALRRTLAGAGWVGAERGEREGWCGVFLLLIRKRMLRIQTGGRMNIREGVGGMQEEMEMGRRGKSGVRSDAVTWCVGVWGR